MKLSDAIDLCYLILTEAIDGAEYYEVAKWANATINGKAFKAVSVYEDNVIFWQDDSYSREVEEYETGRECDYNMYFN